MNLAGISLVQIWYPSLYYRSYYVRNMPGKMLHCCNHCVNPFQFIAQFSHSWHTAVLIRFFFLEVFLKQVMRNIFIYVSFFFLLWYSFGMIVLSGGCLATPVLIFKSFVTNGWIFQVQTDSNLIVITWDTLLLCNRKRHQKSSSLLTTSDRSVLHCTIFHRKNLQESPSTPISFIRISNNDKEMR